MPVFIIAIICVLAGAIAGAMLQADGDNTDLKARVLVFVGIGAAAVAFYLFANGQVQASDRADAFKAAESEAVLMCGYNYRGRVGFTYPVGPRSVTNAVRSHTDSDVQITFDCGNDRKLRIASKKY